MSFPLSDLKKHVRKTKDGHQVTPTRLETRQHAFQVEFVLQQFDQHIGQPRHTLDPDTLLHFIGDPKMGRGLLSTLTQWYRVRPRTFAEVLGREPKGRLCQERLAVKGISSAMELRSWLFDSINRAGDGFLDPDNAELFWRLQARILGVQPEGLRKLARLDRPEEAILVRTGPRPEAQSVMATYTARAHTTLLRSAHEVTLRCGASTGEVGETTRAWCEALDIEWRQSGSDVTLLGRADALGCWTRHGRRVERAVLELLARTDLRIREVRGRLPIGDRICAFTWKDEALALFSAYSSGPGAPERIDEAAQALRKERERSGADCSIRRASHLVGSRKSALLPHLELRQGDRSTYLRIETDDQPEVRDAFTGESPLALLIPQEEAWLVSWPQANPIRCSSGELLSVLLAGEPVRVPLRLAA